MNLQFDDTIAALASAPGPAARGVIRISGLSIRSVLASAFLPDRPAAFESPRTPLCHTGRFQASEVRTPIPVRLYLWPGGRSYTGAPMAEIHTLGSPPLLEAILTELHRRGARPARPGEFTLRAFLAGRIDLTQAEAVLGVIEAHDHSELAQALAQLAGGLSGPIGRIREDLLLLLADLEAGLDFVEEDIEFVSREQILIRLNSASAFLELVQSQSQSRMRTTGRQRVVLAGLPNAGKSTLFNALVGSDAALVSSVQGTTRDYLSAELEWGGLGIELVDTAGWHDAIAVIDRHAQHLRQVQFERADLIVWCTAADSSIEELKQDAELRREFAAQATPTLFVTTKSDCMPASGSTDALSFSAKTGQNLQILVQTVVGTLGQSHAGERQMLGTTASRCRDSLDGCLRALDAARQSAESAGGQEIVSIELRAALEALGTILGTVYTDDILDRIFSRFCIGK